MGLYSRHVFPRLMDVALGSRTHAAIRRRVCAELSGDVVEIGFGTGHNLPFLPPTVRSLRVVDPSGVGFRLARRRIEAAAVTVEAVGLDGQRLPLPDDSADAVLSTWTLCSIPDAVAALREVRRVLRPGGRLHFVEHGLAPDASVARWQHRLDPLQQRLAAGCHLDRDIPALLDAGGLRVTALKRYYAPGEPRFVGSLYEGEAVPA